LIGKERLLRNTREKWNLIAASGREPLLLGTELPEPAIRLMQIWKLEAWDTLYEAMYDFAEAPWFRDLSDTLLTEDQDLLVGVTSAFGVKPRPAWRSDTEPGHYYLYEEVLPQPLRTHSYLKDLNWFLAQVEEFGWQRIWMASQITSRPGLLCLLWSVPTLAGIEDTFTKMKTDDRYRDRYARMMSWLSSLYRRAYYPIYTERLDERIRKGDKDPIVVKPRS
jgi:hypothetical protein